jgi:hypothetical protein
MSSSTHTIEIEIAGSATSAVYRIGVQRPAAALTKPDPATKVCRQRATKVN